MLRRDECAKRREPLSRTSVERLQSLICSYMLFPAKRREILAQAKEARLPARMICAHTAARVVAAEMKSRMITHTQRAMLRRHAHTGARAIQHKAHGYASTPAAARAI